MKVVLACVMASTMLFLGGCSTTVPKKPEPEIVVKYKYIVTTVPEELLTKPEPVPPINLDTATDAIAARWALARDKRARVIELKLDRVREYLDKKVKDLKTLYPDLEVN